jgi:uncharacterized protein YutE (UPF0331/DUF86 family)
MRTLGLITKHLPNTTLDDPLKRITIDERGKVWVTEDTMLVVLKGHLLIEAELIDICGRLLKNPPALGKLGFAARLRLVRALVDDDELPDSFWEAIKDLNDIRNMFAHELEPDGIDKELQKIIGRFDEIEDCRITLHRYDKSIPERLISCFSVLCGALSGIGKAGDEHASEADQ